MNTTTAPILQAYVTDADGCLRVWCAHCQRWHFHGSGAGHRAAHCAKPNSPYDRTGYMLEVVGEWKPDRSG